jgi:hypothetical protein
VAAELELNSISPPPDMIEEDERKKVPQANDLKKSRAPLKSTQSVA